MIPITSRKCAEKAFYVFFALGGKYSGRYAVIMARSYEKARVKALEDFGFTDVRGVVGDRTHAESKIAAFNLQRL